MDRGPMRTVHDHLTAVLRLVDATSPERFPLDAADGLVLAQDVVARTALPRWDCAAMDGYAVRSQDLAGLTVGEGVRLGVIADLAAGDQPVEAVGPGMAARIMTGAPVPVGADTVVPVERTDGGHRQVHVHQGVPAGAHVRRVGEDARAGDVLVPAGELLGSAQVAAVAAAGLDEVLAHRRPRIGVLSTGSELVTPGGVLCGGQVADSNSYLLAAAVRAGGGLPERIGAVPDEPGALREVLAGWDGALDAVVTSGGIGMGVRDVVKALLSGEQGVEFVEVAMQPGRPQGLGRLPGGTPLVALPGNPVAAYVSFQVFVRPLLARLRGLQDVHDATVLGVVRDGWRSRPGRQQYMPVVVEPDGDGPVGVRPASAGGAGAHLVAGLARAQGLAIAGPDVADVRPGDHVRVLPVPR